MLPVVVDTHSSPPYSDPDSVTVGVNATPSLTRYFRNAVSEKVR
jgi:hypothetical protein